MCRADDRAQQRVQLTSDLITAGRVEQLNVRAEILVHLVELIVKQTRTQSKLFLKWVSVIVVGKITCLAKRISVMNMGPQICIATLLKCKTIVVSQTVYQHRRVQFLKVKNLTGEVISLVKTSWHLLKATYLALRQLGAHLTSRKIPAMQVNPKQQTLL
jgi:hypothetical protein